MSGIASLAKVHRYAFSSIFSRVMEEKDYLRFKDTVWFYTYARFVKDPLIHFRAGLFQRYCIAEGDKVAASMSELCAGMDRESIETANGMLDSYKKFSPRDSWIGGCISTTRIWIGL